MTSRRGIRAAAGPGGKDRGERPPNPLPPLVRGRREGTRPALEDAAVFMDFHADQDPGPRCFEDGSEKCFLFVAPFVPENLLHSTAMRNAQERPGKPKSCPCPGPCFAAISGNVN